MLQYHLLSPCPMGGNHVVHNLITNGTFLILFLFSQRQTEYYTLFAVKLSLTPLVKRINFLNYRHHVWLKKFTKQSEQGLSIFFGYFL